jgi:Zn-dependent protease with chaperone function
MVKPQQQSKTFTADEFQIAMRCSELVAVFAFWRRLEYVADEPTRSLARSLLRALAETAFADCQGKPYSLQEAEAALPHMKTPGMTRLRRRLTSLCADIMPSGKRNQRP